MNERGVRFGIDLGGTKVEIVALDATGRERLRRRVPTPREDYHGTVRCIVDLVRAAEATLGVRGSVGIGIPGALSPQTGLVKNANSTWLIGNAFNRDLAQALERPVRLENDANCLAVSEAVDGAGAGERVVFAVILGTGVGGGVAIDGQAWRGRQAIAGEWGHNPLPWPEAGERPGPLCYCGKGGCVEAFLSGPALTAEFLRECGRVATGTEIAGLAEHGDRQASVLMDRYTDRLARALASVINVLDPDAIVVGGGLSSMAQIYLQVPRRLNQYVFSDVCTTPLRAAAHGDSSGVRGAAWLW